MMIFNALCRNATYHRVLLSISKRALKIFLLQKGTNNLCQLMSFSKDFCSEKE